MVHRQDADDDEHAEEFEHATPKYPVSSLVIQI